MEKCQSEQFVMFMTHGYSRAAKRTEFASQQRQGFQVETSIYSNQLIGAKGLKFDRRKDFWIGSNTSKVAIGSMRATA